LSELRHMRLLVHAVLTLVASAALHSAPITVTCAAPLSSNVTSGSTSAASCTSLTNGYSYSGGGANATANVALQLAANGAEFSSLSTYQYAYAQQAPRQSPDALFGPAAESSIAVSYSSTLSTGGRLRSGYLQIQAYGVGAGFHDGGASMTSGILLNSASPYETELTCYSNSGSCTPGMVDYAHNSLIPVMLGTAFTLEAHGQTANWASAFDGSSGGSLNTQYNFRFLEADGITAVQISQAPEPLTVGLVGLAFGLLGIVRRKRSRL
jgi:hypothetical protein